MSKKEKTQTEFEIIIDKILSSGEPVNFDNLGITRERFMELQEEHFKIKEEESGKK